MTRGQKRAIIFASIGVGVLILLSVGFIVFRGFFLQSAETNKPDTKSYTEMTTDIKDTEVTTREDYNKILENYRAPFEQMVNEVRSSDERKWDRDKVEKAYFVIAMSQKVYEYSTIDIVLTKLKTAQDAGVTIDIPSIGATQAYRDEMRKTTDDALKNPNYLPTGTKVTE